jgi:hypothetical protein
VAIVVHLSSGLGNQLFQYAAARRLQLQNGSTLLGDAVALSPRIQSRIGDKLTPRTLALHALALPIRIRPVPTSRIVNLRGYVTLRHLALDGRRSSYVCPGNFDSQFDKLGTNVVLRGYFQDRRYLWPCRDIIIPEIEAGLTNALRASSVCSVDEMRGRAAIHVRRGDVVLHPDKYPEEFVKYYPRMIDRLLSGGVAGVDVYSDDLAFAKRLVEPFGSAVRAIPPKFENEGAADLFAVSRYDVLAISNSTFSFWAALIASMRGGRVIAPSKWGEWQRGHLNNLYDPSWEVAEV